MTGRNVTAGGEPSRDPGKATLEKDIGFDPGLPRLFSRAVALLPCLSVPSTWALWLFDFTLAAQRREHSFTRVGSGVEL